MKKVIQIIIFLIVFTISIWGQTPIPLSLSRFFPICGDVNGDDVVSIVDALLIAKKSVKQNTSTFFESAADVNGDTKINIVDALLVAQFNIDLISRLGCIHKGSYTHGSFIFQFPNIATTVDFSEIRFFYLPMAKYKAKNTDLELNEYTWELVAPYGITTVDIPEIKKYFLKITSTNERIAYIKKLLKITTVTAPEKGYQLAVPFFFNKKTGPQYILKTSEGNYVLLIKVWNYSGGIDRLHYYYIYNRYGSKEFSLQ